MNIVKELIDKDINYNIIDPLKYNHGHGGGLSIKIVLPTYCQAHCEFCFNKDTINTQKHDYDLFLKNLDKSLNNIFNNITNRKVSLNITGNEPTFNIEFYKKFNEILKKHRDKVSGSIILTTNGLNLEKLYTYMENVVNIVNISLHHYDYDERIKIFNTENIPSNEDIKRINTLLKNKNITSTSVAVLYKEFEPFAEFYRKFMNFSIDTGFNNTRFRTNFKTNDSFTEDIFKSNEIKGEIDYTGALTSKYIIDPITNYRTTILAGVSDLTDYVIGAELVIDDDGLCYVDYNKRYRISDDQIKYFNYIYVYATEKGKVKEMRNRYGCKKNN